MFINIRHLTLGEDAVMLAYSKMCDFVSHITDNSSHQLTEQANTTFSCILHTD
jgi:hypothetical protein